MKLRKNIYSFLFAFYVFVRIIVSDEYGFSYDLINYLGYFRYIDFISWAEIYNSIFLTFPFVFVKFRFFEIGFIILVKPFLSILKYKTIYALLASLSVFFRTKILYEWNIPFFFILLIQMYSVALFECNALRAGIALTFTLFFLNAIYKRSFLINLFYILIIFLIHIQSLFVTIPFLLSHLIFNKIIKSQALLYALLILTLVLSILSVSIFDSISFINDISLNQISLTESNATGLNLTTFLGLLLYFYNIKFLKNNIKKNNYVFFLRCVATYVFTISLILMLFESSFVILSDRLWQYVMVVFSAIVLADNSFNKLQKLKNLKLILFFLFIWMNVNIHIRYPVSNILYPTSMSIKLKPLYIVE